MIATIIIIVCIVLYSIWVIRKKIKKAKTGNFCGCDSGCGGCSSKNKCSSDKNNEYFL